MMCRNPYVNKGRAYGCGQCMPCRVNKRREWTHRIMLEASLREDNCFMTLTYEDGKIPISSSGFPTLDRNDLDLWLKRFRKAISPLKLRFYAVGEYGDQTQRPHYHVAVFGYPTCVRGRTLHGRNGHKVCCENCELVYQTWGKGGVDLGSLEVNSAQYIAGYVTKKMTSKTDPRLNGRYPEFGAMSRHPGIGADFMHDVASALLEFDLEDSQTDVPSSLRHGKRLMPLGRYLRGKLREAVGRDKKAPQATLDEAKARLQEVQDAAFNNSERFADAIIKAADNKVLQMETRAKIFKQRRSL